ncbi:nSTAND1 domain-containing NTPase [Flavilitoribacter nigricans]|uniref:Novel STAND NTPase 1 domain-containing protein n=1 Tax=Flavilitoribacter nigricans (strain ATCC 23147 / DSM 23189 / NBRC 102662 / NCIMB 1420 / SS-2) TaxID=1122177 RepID=A0A2D0N0L9_FLAN2|nr:hypothetical protein [Flavilitoribacter nigricans]PHN02007.1 hypothetical protein CRP01_34440 [Flavilitoribacter nigricans DSM 23189 = NBRC 102662]
MKISPFKFLESYRPEDQHLYFGREKETEALYQLVLKSDLVVLFGKSGVGKTSLIQCGLANKFRPGDWLPISIRRGEDYNQALDRKLSEILEKQDQKVAGSSLMKNMAKWIQEADFADSSTVTAKIDHSAVLEDAFEKNKATNLVVRIYNRYLRPVYLVFDQFEELFIKGSEAEKQTFITTLAALDRLEIPCTMLFSLREEYLACLTDCEEQLPHFFDNRLKIEPLRQSEVVTLVTDMFRSIQDKWAMDSRSTVNMDNGALQFTYESKTPERIVEEMTADWSDTSRGSGQIGRTLYVDLPSLQIYLEKLYRQAALQFDSKIDFTTELVTQTLPFQKALSFFLDEVLSQIAEHEIFDQLRASVDVRKLWGKEEHPQRLILHFLKHLFVSPRNTKQPVSRSEIIRFSHKSKLSLEQLEYCLKALKDSWLIRPLEEERFELMHDILAAKIAGKRARSLNQTARIDGNPYLGLVAFQERNAHLFFGRDRVIFSIMDVLDQHPLLVVIGASGSGKSSLIKAGLFPRLRQSGFGMIEILRPGQYPMRALSQAVQSMAAQSEDTIGMVLLIDQFEELVTRAVDQEDINSFVRTLLALIENPGNIIPNWREDLTFKLIITVRSDFEPQFLRTDLEKYWQAGRYVVPTLRHNELLEIIEEPAHLGAFIFEPEDLPDLIAAEVADRSAALPLLSLALHVMSERALAQYERVISKEIYQEVGGIFGALHTMADEIYQQLPDHAHRRTMRQVSLRMVSMEGSELASRRVLLQELHYPSAEENERIQSVLSALVSARLIVRNTDADQEPYIEPAHDALLWSWTTLWEWIRNFGKENILLRERLAVSLLEWENSKSNELLWEGHRLLRLQEILEHKDNWLNQRESDFARTAIEEHKVAEKRIKAKRNYILIGSTTMSLVLLLSTFFAIDQANKAKTSEISAIYNAERAVLVQIQADSLRLMAESAAAEAILQRDIANASNLLAQTLADSARLLQRIAQINAKQAYISAEEAQKQALRAERNATEALLQKGSAQAQADSLARVRDSLYLVFQQLSESEELNMNLANFAMNRSDSLISVARRIDNLNSHLLNVTGAILVPYETKGSIFSHPPARQYHKQLKQMEPGRTFSATWPPSRQITIGAVGRFYQGKFQRDTTLQELGIPFNVTIDSVESISYTSNCNVLTKLPGIQDKKFKAVPNGQSGLKLELKSRGIYMDFQEMTRYRIEDLHIVAAYVLQLYDQGIWRPNWLIVHDVYHTSDGTIVVGYSWNRGFVEFGIEENYDVDSTLTRSLVPLDSAKTHIILSNQTLTPFFQAVGLRQDFKKK